MPRWRRQPGRCGPSLWPPTTVPALPRRASPYRTATASTSACCSRRFGRVALVIARIRQHGYACGQWPDTGTRPPSRRCARRGGLCGGSSTRKGTCHRPPSPRRRAVSARSSCRWSGRSSSRWRKQSLARLPPAVHGLAQEGSPASWPGAVIVGSWASSSAQPFLCQTISTDTRSRSRDANSAVSVLLCSPFRNFFALE